MIRTVVVLPAFNAEKTLSAVVRGLRQHVPGVQIVGINDGSIDGTGALLRSVCDRAIEFTANRGKGSGLRAGFAAAVELGCDTVLTIDSDGQHDPAFAPSLLDALERCHIAIGTRDLSGDQMPMHRRLANYLSTTATRIVSGGAVKDSQSGFRAIRREVIDEIHPEGERYEFETDFIVRAANAGFTIMNVPISTIYGPPSYFREFRDAARVIGVLWAHRGGAFRKHVPRPIRPLRQEH
jgi:glycosyltransferase involved in cell wall biosynthesis